MPRRAGHPSLTPLTLGAAAIGQSYGISNPGGTMTDSAARTLLDRCWTAGIRSIDTAASYGEAEERIGRWRAERAIEPVIITKSLPLRDVAEDEVVVALERSVRASRAKLGVSAIDGYLLHGASDWRRAPVRAALRAAKESGHVRSYGVSAYDADEVLELLAIDRFDMLQIPFSLFDRRAEACGLLQRASDLGIVVLARSVFLQGLLYLDPERLEMPFQPAGPPLARLRELVREAGSDLTAAAIHAALHESGISSVIVGLYSAKQVDQAASALAAPVDDSLIRQAIGIASEIPAELRDPRLWHPK